MLRGLIIGLALPLVLLGCGGLGLEFEEEVSATATLSLPATARAADTPVAIARVSDTPRAADTPTAPEAAATAHLVATPLAVLPSFTPDPVATRTPEPTWTPVPAATAISSAGAQVVRDENAARCLHWALRNMEPIAFARFERLDPYSMSDLERALWGGILIDAKFADGIEDYYQHLDRSAPSYKANYVEWCQDYWSEALHEGNVDKRNHERSGLLCKLTLETMAVNREEEVVRNFERYADREEEISSVVVNQALRLLNWMDIQGWELLQMEDKPADLVRRNWSEGGDRYRQSQYAGDYIPLAVLSSEDKEWWRIEQAWGKNDVTACKNYYPQLFFNRWIPLDDFGLDDKLAEWKRDFLDDGRDVEDWEKLIDVEYKEERDIIIRLER